MRLPGGHLAEVQFLQAPPVPVEYVKESWQLTVHSACEPASSPSSVEVPAAHGKHLFDPAGANQPCGQNLQDTIRAPVLPLIVSVCAYPPAHMSHMLVTPGVFCVDCIPSLQRVQTSLPDKSNDCA